MSPNISKPYGQTAGPQDQIAKADPSTAFDYRGAGTENRKAIALPAERAASPQRAANRAGKDHIETISRPQRPSPLSRWRSTFDGPDSPRRCLPAIDLNPEKRIVRGFKTTQSIRVNGGNLGFAGEIVQAADGLIFTTLEAGAHLIALREGGDGQLTEEAVTQVFSGGSRAPAPTLDGPLLPLRGGTVLCLHGDAIVAARLVAGELVVGETTNVAISGSPITLHGGQVLLLRSGEQLVSYAISKEGTLAEADRQGLGEGLYSDLFPTADGTTRMVDAKGRVHAFRVAIDGTIRLTREPSGPRELASGRTRYPRFSVARNRMIAAMEDQRTRTTYLGVFKEDRRSSWELTSKFPITGYLGRLSPLSHDGWFVAQIKRDLVLFSLTRSGELRRHGSTEAEGPVVVTRDGIIITGGAGSVRAYQRTDAGEFDLLGSMAVARPFNAVCVTPTGNIVVGTNHGIDVIRLDLK